MQRTWWGLRGRPVMGGGGRAGGTSGGVSLPGVLSRSGGVVGTSSALFLRD